MNKVILIGNLAADPETRQTASGVTMCTFRLAVQRRFANQQGVREADFFNITTWRQTAETCGRYLSKGRRVCVEGSLQNRSYDAQDGTKRFVTDIVAENVEFLSSRNEAAGFPRTDEVPAPHTAPAASAPAAGNVSAGFTDVTAEDDELPF
jgi:single stranded DNA-binding protein (ssb)